MTTWSGPKLDNEASKGARRAGTGRGASRPDGRHGIAPLDSALKHFLRASGIGERLGPWTIFQAWSEAAGPAFARQARAVRFARGELQVEVDSAPHLSELKGYRGEEIRARTNQILGREDIRRITFRLSGGATRRRQLDPPRS